MNQINIKLKKNMKMKINFSMQVIWNNYQLYMIIPKNKITIMGITKFNGNSKKNK